jgi:hypothetical protein
VQWCCSMLVACSRSSCEMCASSQMRECDSAAPKRLYEDEVLSTPCDSPNIWVELHMGNQSNCPLRDLGVEVLSHYSISQNFVLTPPPPPKKKKKKKKKKNNGRRVRFINTRCLCCKLKLSGQWFLTCFIYACCVSRW